VQFTVPYNTSVLVVGRFERFPLIVYMYLILIHSMNQSIKQFI